MNYASLVHRNRFAIAFIVLLLLVAAKVHFSSIGAWDDFFKVPRNQNQCVVLGHLRTIRSDEWLVNTPYYLSQSIQKPAFPRINPNIRSDGQNMNVAIAAPVLDITAIAKPFNWGFFLFGGERGLSWFWCLRYLLLFLFSYELCLYLLKGNRPVSLLGAFWIAFSPPLQWWFSTTFVDLMIFSQALILSTVYYFKNADRKWIRRSFLVAFWLSALAYVFALYPPMQVPLGYLTALMILGVLVRNRQKIVIIRQDLLVLFLAATLFVGVLAYFVVTSRDALQIMMGTVYPGVRRFYGGGFDFRALFYTGFNMMLPFRAVGGFSNNCAASSYLMLLPALLFVFVRVRDGLKEQAKLMYLLLGYAALLLFYLLIPFPGFVGRYSLLSYSTEMCVFYVAQIAILYVNILALPTLLSKAALSKLEGTLLGVVLLGINLAVLLKSPFQQIWGSKDVLVAALLLALLNALYLCGRRLFAGFLVLSIVASGVIVNPLSVGVKSIYAHGLSKAIQRVHSQDPAAKWVATSNGHFGQYLIAHGVKTLDGVHFYPDLKMWRRLDPEGKYNAIYNRYAHVVVDITPGKSAFDTPYPDVVHLSLGVKDLKTTGVKYVMSANDLSTMNTKNDVFTQIYADSESGQRIFRYSSNEHLWKRRAI